MLANRCWPIARMLLRTLSPDGSASTEVPRWVNLPPTEEYHPECDQQSSVTWTVAQYSSTVAGKVL